MLGFQVNQQPVLCPVLLRVSCITAGWGLDSGLKRTLLTTVQMGRLQNCSRRIQQLLISISFPTASHLQRHILKHFFTLRIQKLLLNCRGSSIRLALGGESDGSVSHQHVDGCWFLSSFTVCSGVENLEWGRMGRAMSQELKLETAQWCHRLRHVEGAMSNSSLMNASASTCLPAQVTSPPDYQRVHSRGGDERSGRLHREESG